MCSLLLSFWIVFLNRTEYCQDHQAETHEEQQDEVLEEEVWREPVGAMLSVLQVLVHAVHQAVGPGAVTQLSAGFVNLEGVTHSYAPHLHGRGTQSTSVTTLLKVTLWCNQMVAYGYCIFLLVRDKLSACDTHTHTSKNSWTIFPKLSWTGETIVFIFLLTLLRSLPADPWQVMFYSGPLSWISRAAAVWQWPAGPGPRTQLWLQPHHIFMRLLETPHHRRVRPRQHKHL